MFITVEVALRKSAACSQCYTCLLSDVCTVQSLQCWMLHYYFHCQSLGSFMLVSNASVEPWWRYCADVEVWQALRRAESKPWSTANYADRSSEKIFSGESTSLDTDYGTKSKLTFCHQSFALNQDSYLEDIDHVMYLVGISKPTVVVAVAVIQDTAYLWYLTWISYVFPQACHVGFLRMIMHTISGLFANLCNVKMSLNKCAIVCTWSKMDIGCWSHTFAVRLVCSAVSHFVTHSCLEIVCCEFICVSLQCQFILWRPSLSWLRFRSDFNFNSYVVVTIFHMNPHRLPAWLFWIRLVVWKYEHESASILVCLWQKTKDFFRKM